MIRLRGVGFGRDADGGPPWASLGTDRPPGDSEGRWKSPCESESPTIEKGPESPADSPDMDPVATCMVLARSGWSVPGHGSFAVEGRADSRLRRTPLLLEFRNWQAFSSATQRRHGCRWPGTAGTQRVFRCRQASQDRYARRREASDAELTWLTGRNCNPLSLSFWVSERGFPFVFCLPATEVSLSAGWDDSMADAE